MIIKDDIYYMKQALIEAKKAYALKEVPVGCVIVSDGKIIARAYNMRHNKKCSIYHAEILAIEKACKKLDRWILSGCTMYVTLEPCLMCSGAIVQSRIDKVVYGIPEDRFGCFHDALTYFEAKQNHYVEVSSMILDKDISEMMSNFFKEIRDEKRK